MSTNQFGRYEIKSELGRGGMATVYRAYDPFFKREVALKVLPRAFLHDPQFRARFEREAQTVASLEHAAIVPVYDYGEEDGQPYLVMRLMGGGSLAERLRRGSLSLAETITLLERLAPALDRAHSLGIVHRDLKPGNILFDTEGNPYISDFGLAKAVQGGSQLTQQTGVMGTPAYMSPEQARGSKDITTRSDLYTLGVIVFHLLSGQLPFDADTPMGIAYKHVSEPPPRLRALRPDLPASAEAALLTALAKDPQQRFASAADFLKALKAPSPPPASQPATAYSELDTRPPSLPPPGFAPTQFASPSPVAPASPPPVASQPPAAPPIPPSAFASPPNRRRSPLLLWAALGLVVVVVAAGVVGLGYAASVYLFPVLVAATDTPGVATATLAAVGPTGSAPTDAPTSEVAVTLTIAPTDSQPTDAPAPTDTVTAPTPTPEAGAQRTSAADGMVQAYVPAGQFTMGNNAGPADQQPEHQVFLDSFWIDVTEVTNAQYAQCVSTGQCTPPLETRSFSRADYYSNPDFANHPVLFVNWTQANSYCEWAGRRLPTEAEWEKAARGDDVRPYPWGNEPPDATRLNFGASGFSDTIAVGQYPNGASPYGALDMAGNAWEWVADWYDPGYYAISPSQNPTGPAVTGCPEGDCKVLRGGSWDSTDAQATTTSRLFFGPNDSRDAFTIRCAQSP